MNNLKQITKRGLNYILVIPLLLVIATLFRVDYTMANPTVSAKYSWFAISLLLAAVSCLLIFLFNRIKVKVLAVDILVSIFFLWGICYTYFLQEYFSFKLCILTMLWILYLISRITLSQVRNYSSIMLFALILTGLIEAIWGEGQLHNFFLSHHKLFKTTGSFFNSGPYAGYLATILPIAFYYILFDYSALKDKFSWTNLFRYVRWGVSSLSVALILSILPATMSRASWLAAIVSCIFILVVFVIDTNKEFFIHQVKRHKRKFSLGIAFGIIILIVGISSSYYMKKDSADGRILIWKTTIQSIQNNPFGVGAGRFSKYYGEAQKEYFSKDNASDQEKLVAGSPEYAFNEYLQIGLEFGLLSLALFILILISTLYKGFQLKNYPALGGLISLLAFAFMSYPFSLLPFLITLITLVTLSIEDGQSKKIQADTKGLIFGSLLIIFALLITSTIIYKRINTSNAYREWAKLKLFTNAESAIKLPTYVKIFPELCHEARFLFEYAQSLNLDKRYEESNNILSLMTNISCDPMIYNVMGRNYQSMKNYEQAEAAFLKASYMVPSRLYPYYLLAKLYEETDEREKALFMVEILLTKEAKVESEAVNDIREEAKRIFEKYKSN